MKSNLKLVKVILFTLGILYIFFPIIANNLNYIIGNSDNTMTYGVDFSLDNENLKFSKVSGPIYIDNNEPSSNWSVAEGAGLCTGNGTYSNPYIIEDLVINGGGSGSCILIENSDVYFRIENCTVYNAGGDPDAGILLSHVNNSQLIGNTASDNGEYGICLFFSDYNNISGNTANDNGNEGIKLINSDYNIVSGNIANSNYDGGIGLSESDYNIVSGSTTRYNDAYGIALASDSNNNHISGNTANDNYYGIYLSLSDYNTISGNTLIGNTECIIEENCQRNTFSDNGDCTYGESDGEGDGAIPGYNIFFLLGILSILVILISKGVKKT